MAVLSLVVLAALSVAALANAYAALDPRKAWREDVTYDFSDLDFEANFEDWKTTFNKTYATKAAEKRAFGVWLRHWEMINEFNKKDRPYKLGLNQFGDMTATQFRRYVHGGRGSCVRRRTVAERAKMREWVLRDSLKAPASVDWTNVNGQSYVTPVKDQGQCGSCWAFSTTGSIESRNAIATGTTGLDIVMLSEQQLVDCSRAEGNMGCNGGLMDDAFQYVMKEGGLCSEKEYPYHATDGRCKASTCGKLYAPISSYTDVKHDSEPSLVDATAAGPVSVAIEADQTAFQHYKSGIIDGVCGTRLDHGVLVVGYGTQNGVDFWKVKNSWGTSWGEDGYVRICRNCNKNHGQGECGILEMPSFPVPKANVVKESPDFLDKILHMYQL